MLIFVQFSACIVIHHHTKPIEQFGKYFGTWVVLNIFSHIAGRSQYAFHHVYISVFTSDIGFGYFFVKYIHISFCACFAVGQRSEIIVSQSRFIYKLFGKISYCFL